MKTKGNRDGILKYPENLHATLARERAQVLLSDVAMEGRMLILTPYHRNP